MIASSDQIQFAPPKDSKPGGTIAKRPAAGPTSRLLRVLLHAPDQTSAPDSVLDQDRLEELRTILSPAEIREFVWRRVVDTELLLADIAARRAAADLESVAEIAHRIARDAAKLGALHVHVLALRLETACRTGKCAGTYGLISELSNAWTQVGDKMCAWATGQASSPAV